MASIVKATVLLLTVLAGLCTGSEEENKCSSVGLSSSVNNFGFDLVEKIDSDDNMIISPLSTYTVLAMAYVGAGGETAAQIRQALRLEEAELTNKELNKAIKKLLRDYQEHESGYSLDLANGLFMQKNLNPRKRYVKKIKKYYEAEVKEVDFAHDSKGATEEINKWVSEKTKGKIEELLSEPLDASSYLALLNAIYFKGKWVNQFEKEFTKSGTFNSGPENSVEVKYMNQHNKKFPFHHDYEDEYKFLELPYAGDNVTMLIALPKKQQDVPTLKMDSSKLCTVRSKLKRMKLREVTIPRFHLESDLDLKSSLEDLGILDLFAGPTNLTGISRAHGLIVSKVVHKGVIDVDEEGSEAAAATGAHVIRLSADRNPDFVADHPFIFYIVDTRSNMVLFTGHVIKPTDPKHVT